MSKSTNKGSSGSPSNKGSGGKATGNTGTRTGNKGETRKGGKK